MATETDFSKEFENFRKICIELEHKSKKDEMKCLMLETEVENFRKICIELKEKSKKDEKRCLMLETEVENLKTKNQQLEGKIRMIKEVLVYSKRKAETEPEVHTEFTAAEVSQPVEEAANAFDAPIVDDPPSTKFIWTIENFSRLTAEKLYSDEFIVGGYKWRVLMFPKGNGVDCLSVYLDVADSTILPYGWSRDAQFSLAVVDQINRKFTVLKDAQHQFHARESDWGFTSFMPLSELYDPRRGYLLNDTCIVEVDVAVRKVVDNRSHDINKETGFVELKSQGATCYMNSLLRHVAPAEASNGVDAPIVDDPTSARFTWTVENFSRLTGKELFSDVFVVGGYKWRVRIFPKGNGEDHLSMYLDVADSTTLPYGWSRDAQFSLAVVDQIHNKFTIMKDTKHKFNARESDWGFTTFMPLSDLYDPSKGYLLNDACIVEASVAVPKVVDVENSIPVLDSFWIKG